MHDLIVKTKEREWSVLEECSFEEITSFILRMFGCCPPNGRGTDYLRLTITGTSIDMVVRHGTTERMLATVYGIYELAGRAEAAAAVKALLHA